MTRFSLRPALLAASASGLALLSSACVSGITDLQCHAVSNVQVAVHGDSIVTSTGLVYLDLAQGTDPAVRSTDECQEVAVRYQGRLENGTVFDQTSAGSTASFTVGAGMLIRGFEQGLVGMREGGRRQLFIPASLAYGSQPVRDNAGNIIIPANSKLIFDVTLVSVD
jgi:peptidylprolyl isomerase